MYIFDLVSSPLVRSLGCLFTSFLFALAISPKIIKFLRANQMAQSIRETGPQQHFVKKGTPTMGGIIIISTILLNILLWADLSSHFTLMFLVVAFGYGAIGFYDDYLKIKHKNSAGISAKAKFSLQVVLAIAASSLLYLNSGGAAETSVFAPFLVKYSYNLGLGYILFASFVIVAFSNAVNLTDGLDGLVSWQVIIVSIGFGVIIYFCHTGALPMAFNSGYALELGEVLILCGAIVGSTLAFLWYNSYPAEVFMGDVGSLSLGAMLGIIAVFVHQEFLFVVMGLIFVLETLSVVLQVLSFKLRNGKRIFKMAPLHHHFEMLGWPETKVVARFTIITVLLTIFSVSVTMLV